MSCPSISAETPLVFHPDDEQTYALNFTQFGIGSRTISSVGTITVTSEEDEYESLVFDDEEANSAIIQGEHDQDVAIGKAVLFTMSGGVAAADYTITVPATLSDGSFMHGVFRGECRDA